MQIGAAVSIRASTIMPCLANGGGFLLFLRVFLSYYEIIS